MRAIITALFAIAVCVQPALTGAQVRPGQNVTSLVNEASGALDEKRFGDALGAFERAAQLVPKDASIAFGAGYAATMLGRLAEGRTWLEQALALQPRFPEASALLGQLLYRQGKVAEAVAAYDAVLAYQPNDQKLRALRDQWRKEAQLSDRFYEARGARFSVRFEGPADDVAARRVLEIFEQAYWRIGGILSRYPAETIVVVLYTGQQFRDVTRSPAWAGGAYDGRIKIPMVGALDRSDELRRILEHEFVHALVASLAGSTVPVWLNEGLAAAMEPGDLRWASDTLKGEPSRLSYSQLERSFGELSDKDSRIAYAQSALAVKRLLDLRGPSAMGTLLQSLGGGAPFQSAFEAAMLMRLEEFQTAIAR